MAYAKVIENLVTSLTFSGDVTGVIVAYHKNRLVAEEIAAMLPFKTELIAAEDISIEEADKLAQTVSNFIEVYRPGQAGYQNCRRLRDIFLRRDCQVLSLFDWEESYLEDDFWIMSNQNKLVSDIALLSETIGNARDWHITSDIGTDISFSTAGRRWLGSDGMCRMNGRFAQLPDGEVFTCPVEETFTGVIMVDGTVTRSWVPTTPQRLEFRQGRLYTCSAEFRNHIVHIPDEYRVIGEFAIGMNTGIDRLFKNISVDEKAAGTIHFALGDSYGLGKSSCAYHLDFVVRNPLIEVAPNLNIPFLSNKGKREYLLF